MADQDDSTNERRKPGKGLTIAGAAVGIGSAAIVAALLYARRPKSTKPKPRRDAEPAD